MTSATKIIGEKGFQNATIAEIAKEAGIGDATIYEYFKNKEDLLLAIPVETTKDLIAQINDHMMGIKGAFNKLRKFIWWWLNYVEKNPGYGVSRVARIENKQELMYRRMPIRRQGTFIKLFSISSKKVKRKKTIKKEMNPYLARSLCVGAMEHIIIRWLLKDRKYSLIQYADELADLLIDSLRKTDLKFRKRWCRPPNEEKFFLICIILILNINHGGIDADTQI